MLVKHMSHPERFHIYYLCINIFYSKTIFYSIFTIFTLLLILNIIHYIIIRLYNLSPVYNRYNKNKY